MNIKNINTRESITVMNTKGSQVNKDLSDGQTRSLRAMNIEKAVEMAIFAAASNMAQMEEQGTDGKSSWMSLRQTGSP